MTARDYLAEVTRLADQATDGVWSVHEDEFYARITIESGFDLAHVGSTMDDAEFIAASREAVPRLVKALEAVLEMHQPEEGGTPNCDPATVCKCGPCYWPCPTVQAIESALSPVGSDGLTDDEREDLARQSEQSQGRSERSTAQIESALGGGE